MTLSIPPVNDWTTLQYALDLIAQQFPFGTEDMKNGAVTAPKLATGIVLQLNTTGTARKLAVGTDTATFTASNTGLKTVTHGLGATPVLILVVPSFPGGITPYTGAVDTATAPTSTQFVARLSTNPSTTNVSVNCAFYWAAIG